MSSSALWDGRAAGGAIRLVVAQKLRAARRMVDGSTGDPAAAQAGCLRALLSHNRDTTYNYFYEFIPLEGDDEYRAGRKPPLLLHEVEEGRKYHLIQTGIHGFYRYEVQDIVEINGRYRETPTFEFVQKSGSFTSLAGERLYEFQVSDAVAVAGREESALAPASFVAYADAESRRYLVVAEFRAPPEPDGLERFEEPEVHVLEPGGGDLYVQWVSESALYDIQAKIHRLKPDYQDDFAYFGIVRQPV